MSYQPPPGGQPPYQQPPEQAGYPGPPYPPPPPPYPTQINVAVQRTNGSAITSVIVGIASWIICPFIGAVVAIVLGHSARHQIRRTQEAGDGYAIAGLVLGYAHLVIYGLILFVIVLMTFGVCAAIVGSGTSPAPTP